MSSSNLYSDLVALRHHFHSNPEPGFEEVETQKRLKQEAIKAGVPETNIKVCAKTGLIIDVHGLLPHKSGVSKGINVIALRADMDCLRMTENNPNLPYASSTPGLAHMCGHDGHMATMIGVLRIIQANAIHIPQSKTVRFLFQPAEEKPGGAEPMIAEGCLNGVEEVYGYHNWPVDYVGSLNVIPGSIMAAECDLEIVILGRGGHASQPHHNADPIVCAAVVVTSLQTIVSRTVPSNANAVVTIAMIHGGEAKNVTPDRVTMKGTIRVLEMEILETIKEKMQCMVDGLCLAHDCTSTVLLTEGYPVTCNTIEETNHVLRVGKHVLGEDKVGPSAYLPCMGAEDFSYYTQKKPGCFFFLGGREDGRSNAINHSSQFDFNDKTLPYSVQVFVRLVEDRLDVPICTELQDIIPIVR